MKNIYLSSQGMLLQEHDAWFSLPGCSMDAVFNTEDLPGLLSVKTPLPSRPEFQPLAPLQSQEVWAAGVTYLRSRDARMEESVEIGGADCYERVYHAPRPEIFFKAPAYRVVAPGQDVRIRADSRWNVPEPELTLAINSRGQIFGCTVGNDMSSRDIEGENPLYLPQAKIYDGSCALGPCLTLMEDLPDAATQISLRVFRGGNMAFSADTALSQMKRALPELVGYLFRETTFPQGCYLMTGTGIVPPQEFTLQPRDRIEVEITGIGILSNTVAG